MNDEEAHAEGSTAPTVRGVMSWWKGVEVTVWRDEK